ncbi:MAG: alpha/beta hydrolase fold domain-containing protein [Pseudomonadota bacterium]
MPVSQIPKDPAFSARHKLRRALIHRSLSTLARFGERKIKLGEIESGLAIQRDIPYGPAPEQLLDVVRPRGASGPRPVLLYIHGGAFTTCSRQTHRAVAALYASRAGYVVFNIDYRLAPRHRYPAAIEDACAAYRWVADRCAQYGGDPQRIVIAGESAGGNLALGVACAASYERPEPYAKAVYEHPVRPVAVMPLMPVLQVSDPLSRRASRALPDWAIRILEILAMNYLGERRPAACEALMFADPIRLLEAKAPAKPFPQVFTGVGTADLCEEDAKRLHSVALRWSIASELHQYQGEPHAFQAMWWRPHTQQFWDDQMEFLKAVSP